MPLKLNPEIKKRLKNAGYGVYNHSAVEICVWNKLALKGEGFCYKNKFYGIETHRCMQFSPAVVFCHNRCIYCWRKSEMYKNVKIRKDDVDRPEEIVKVLLDERKRLLSGFGGNKKTKRNIYIQSLIPSHFAISLSGEPTLYPLLPELITYLKSLETTKSIFLVTNGQEPKMLKILEDKQCLPTQLYISMNAGTKKTFFRVNCPLIKNSWERFNKSLEILSKIKTRVVVRITLIKGVNDNYDEIEGFLNLLKKTNPHFIEIKSYIHIGHARKRLLYENMLNVDEIKKWGNRLLSKLDNFNFMDEEKRSRIVVFQNEDRYVERKIL